MLPTKILISPGYGAGWSTWMGLCTDDGARATAFLKWVLTYQPLIDAIERGEKLVPENWGGGIDDPDVHIALVAFSNECADLWGVDPCVLGARNLEVVIVYGPFRVTEYDGAESVQERDRMDWIAF